LSLIAKALLLKFLAAYSVPAGT